MKKLEIVPDDTLLLDESYGVDISNFTSSTPGRLSVYENKD